MYMVYSNWGFPSINFDVFTLITPRKSKEPRSRSKHSCAISISILHDIFPITQKNVLKRSSGNNEHASMQYMSHTATCFSVYLWLDSR